MQNAHAKSMPRKILPALIAGVGVGLFLVVTVLALGLNALFNPNVTATKNAADKNADPPVSQASAGSAQDVQALISQYQSRETQYQNELKQAADQINQLSQQNQQYLQLFQALQNAGIIQVSQDGRIFVNPGGGFRSGFGGENEP